MKIFGLDDAAEFMKGLVSADSLREMADNGTAPAAKIGPNGGRTWIFTDEGLEQFIREEIARQTAERRKLRGNLPTTEPEQKPAQTKPERNAAGRRRRGPPPILARSGQQHI